MDFDVDRHQARSRGGQRLEEGHRVGHHEMAVEVEIGCGPQRLDHRHAERQVRNEVTVHHIDMEKIDHIGNSRNVVGEMRKVRGEDRGGDLEVRHLGDCIAAPAAVVAPTAAPVVSDTSPERTTMSRYQIAPGMTVDLDDHDPRDLAMAANKDAGRKLLSRLNERLEALQEVLYAEGRHRVLVVLQATDTGGKDGTIRHVFDGTNPQGVKVASFKVPTPRERAHDYLWRVHDKVPGNGEITVFNRSHYEDVLVVRVHGLVKEERWTRRYRQINEFERMLVEEGTTIVKFFLNISKDEQKERLQARLDDPTKHWKFSLGDLEERALWDDYRRAFEAVLSRTSTEWAAWHVVPADRKWYRNLVVASTLVETLEALAMNYPTRDDDLTGITIE